MADTQRVHSSPRMGINAITEYMTAPAGRRATILRDQKYPTDFKVTWYREAGRVAVRFLLDPSHDEEILIRAIDRYYAASGTKHEQNRLQDNAKALEGLLGGYGDITYDALVPSRGPTSGNIEIEGVRISVRPEIVLAGSHRKKSTRAGIKLYLSKNSRLNDESATITASVLHEFVKLSLNPNESVSKQHCQVMDVFSGTTYEAPAAVVRRRRELEAACREIVQLWPSIKPRKSR